MPLSGFFIIGAILAIVLITIILRISIEKDKANKRLRIMFNTMPLGVNIHDKDMNILDCNDVSVRMLGLSNKKEYFEKFKTLSPEYQPDGRRSWDKTIENVNKALTDGYCHFEWMLMRADGEPLPCEITLVRFLHNGEYVITVYIRDLREIKAATAAKEQAIQANRDKSIFLAKISHEVRTTINVILGITEMQLHKASLEPETQEALDRIYSSGYFLLGIINNLLDLSKIEAGKLELSPVNYDVVSLINDAVSVVAISYNTKPVEFDIHVDENIPSKLFGDDLKIRQILNNLLSNAFKYTKSGRVALSISADINEVQGEAALVFRISDTGQGMNPEQIKKLFDEYARFNTDADHVVEGVGLGMSIAKQLIDLMNGTISVKSEPGKGSEFTVHLPQELVGSVLLGKEAAENIKLFYKNSLSRIREEPKIIREYMPYGRVLLADDMPINLSVEKGLLAPYGISVETALQGSEVIEKIKNGASYDIIFMDHYMPGIDGVETAKIIRELGYTKPIIALTANATAAHADSFLSKGFDAFLLKPVDIRQLNVILNKYIRDKYPPEVIETARRQAVLFKLK